MDSWEDDDTAILESLQERLRVQTVEEEKPRQLLVVEKVPVVVVEVAEHRLDKKKVEAAFDALAKGNVHPNPLKVVLDYLRDRYDFNEEKHDISAVTRLMDDCIDEVPRGKGGHSVEKARRSLVLPRALLVYAYSLTVSDGPSEVAVNFRKYRGHFNREPVFTCTVRFERQPLTATVDSTTRFYKQLAYMDALVLRKDYEKGCAHMSNQWVIKRARRPFSL